MREQLIKLLQIHNLEELGINIKIPIELYVDKIINFSTVIPYFKEGKLMAFISYYNNDSLKDNSFLTMILVAKEFQGKGIGKLLIDSIAQFAKENSSNSLLLNVNRFNKALIFYQKLGFKIIQEIDIELEHGYLMEDYVMKKEM